MHDVLIHLLRHEDHEGPGHIENWAKTANHELVCLDARTADYPIEFDAVSFLIILGGALNTDDDQTHPWLTQEKRFIKRVTNGPAYVETADFE